MKKLMLLIAAACFVFVSCNNKPAEETVATEENTEVAAEGQHCCQMTEEQKAFKADWENWENQTEERKAELIAKAKECFDKRMAECEAHKAECEANKPECEAKKAECEAHKAECEAKKAEIEKIMANWDNMTIEEQKAFFDENAPCCKGHKCCKEAKEGCCKKEGEGCCKDGQKPCEKK